MTCLEIDTHLRAAERAVLDAALAFARSGESFMGPAANRLHYAAIALREARERALVKPCLPVGN